MDSLELRRNFAFTAAGYREQLTKAKRLREAAPYLSAEYNAAAHNSVWYSAAYFATRRAWRKLCEASI
jgi:hypothetical protein